MATELDEIEVTPEMILAGVKALSAFVVGEDPSDWIVADIFAAMRRVAPAPRPLQLSDLSRR